LIKDFMNRLPHEANFDRAAASALWRLPVNATRTGQEAVKFQGSGQFGKVSDMDNSLVGDAICGIEVTLEPNRLSTTLFV